jgi:hypothetical protein
MLRKANNVFGTVVSDVTKLTADLPGIGDVVTNDNLEEGAVVLVDGGNVRRTFATIATGDIFHIVQGRGATKPLNKSAAIEKGTETMSFQKHLAAIQQITTIGSNGTTGDLPSADDTSYYIKLRKNDNDEGNRSQPFSLFGQYKTGTGATQREVAFGLAVNFTANMAKEAAGTNGYVAIQVTTEAADAVIGGITSISIAEGSKTGTFFNGGSLATPTLAVGDLVRVEGSGFDKQVYEVKALAGAVVTFDRPLVLTTGFGTTSFASPRKIVAATANTAVYGIKLTGIESAFDVNKFRNYFANRFTATFSDASTLVTSVAGARGGSGVWQQVAMDEYMSAGFDGENGMLGTPPSLRDASVKIPGVGGQTAATCRYSSVTLAWTSESSELVGISKGKGSVIIYLNLDASGDLSSTTNTGRALADTLGVPSGDLDA